MNALRIPAFLAFLAPSFAIAQPEAHYQNLWCAEQPGIAEFILHDQTRVDCLTETHAIEVDFAKKWAEAIGQSLYYSYVTGKQPGILLIVEEKDARFVERIEATNVFFNLGITVWLITR